MNYVTKFAKDKFTVEMLPAKFMEYLDYLTNCDYVPTTKKEIFDLSYTDFKILMSFNMPFYNAAIVLLDEEISAYIQQLCEGNDYRGLKKVKTLDDLLLHTRYFGRKYEDRRQEFVSCLSSYLACKFEF